MHTTDYYRPCEMEKNNFNNLAKSYSLHNVTVLGLEEPKCSPDGYFQPLLETTNTYVFKNTLFLVHFFS